MAPQFRIILWVLLFASLGVLSRPLWKGIVDKSMQPQLTRTDRLHIINEMNARLPLKWADNIRWVSATYSEADNTIQMNFEILRPDGTVDPFVTIGCDLPAEPNPGNVIEGDPAGQMLARTREHFCQNGSNMQLFRREFAGVSLRFLDGQGGASCMTSLSFADCGISRR